MGWMDGWVGGGGLGPSGFPIALASPWLLPRPPVTGSRGETRDQGAAQSGLGPPPAGGPGDEPREGAGSGVRGDWKA